MYPGELRHKITIQQNNPHRDTDGSQTDTWETFKTAWAGIITTGGKEFYAAQKINAETNAVFKIRYMVGITTAMRIKYTEAGIDRYFDILFINNVGGLSRELQIQCKEVV